MTSTTTVTTLTDQGTQDTQPTIVIGPLATTIVTTTTSYVIAAAAACLLLLLPRPSLVITLVLLFLLGLLFRLLFLLFTRILLLTPNPTLVSSSLSLSPSHPCSLPSSNLYSFSLVVHLRIASPSPSSLAPPHLASPLWGVNGVAGPNQVRSQAASASRCYPYHFITFVS